MCDRDRLEDVCLGYFDRAALDHHDRVFRAGDDDVHVAVRKLLECRIENPVLLHASDANSGDRSHERDLRGVERVRRGDERHHVGVILLIGGDDVDEDLNLVLESFREQRPDGAIDDSRLQDLGVVRAAFALDESAGNFSGCVCLVAVLDEKWEKRERAFGVADRNCCENHRLAKLN